MEIINYFQKIVNVREYELNSRQEKIELLVYSIVSFMIPFVIKQPQFVVGTFVNMMLILAAMNLKGKKILPIIIIPSIAAFLGGFLFGGLTIYLLYLMPIIWIGNSILVFVFKHFNLQKKKNFFLTLGIGAVTKTALLFGITFLLVSFSIVPFAFLIAMGALQLFTALTGGVLAFAVQRIKRKS